MTSYVVLRRVDGRWEEITDQPIPAHNDRVAIREATKDLSAQERSGTFVAVPTRSWRPRARQVETKEIDRWS